MNKNYELIFDKVVFKQLKKAGKNKEVKEILRKMFDKVEEKGPLAGELLDSQLFLYEVKNIRPPLRLYYQVLEKSNQIKVFEFEMKTSALKQRKTIQKIKTKASET
ncbi:MAG: hypothetical protein AABX70_00330 [Nanoarchaeota archaeon]